MQQADCTGKHRQAGRTPRKLTAPHPQSMSEAAEKAKQAAIDAHATAQRKVTALSNGSLYRRARAAARREVGNVLPATATATASRNCGRSRTFNRNYNCNCNCQADETRTRIAREMEQRADEERRAQAFYAKVTAL
jgi:hypothetical protein